MKKIKLKGLLSLCLSLCIVSMPRLAIAQELDQTAVEVLEEDRDYAQENNLEGGTLSDLYEEVVRVKSDSKYTPNNMERPYDESEYSISEVFSGLSTYALEENTDPNNAYLAESGNTVQGTLTQTGETRWYGFVLDQTSKIAIMVQTLATVDADLYVYQLDQNTYTLKLIGGSISEGFGVQEYCPGVLVPGIYYFAIKSYEGSGAYAFAFYASASQDMGYEPNDTVNTAAKVGVNDTITGVIDSPFDEDYYTFTLTSPIIMRISVDVGDYQYAVLDVDSAANMYKISQKEDLYRLDAGTHYFKVYSMDRSYDTSQTYEIKLDKIADISGDPNSTLFMVNEPTKIVFQCDAAGQHMYVNGNDINIFYEYALDASNQAGEQIYNIYMYNNDNVRAIIYDTEAAQLALPMPSTVYYLNGTAGVGKEKLHVLALSLVCTEAFYTINCHCTGAYIGNNLDVDLNYAVVYIDPDTGKLIDIETFNYFYDHIGGSHKMHFTNPYGHLCRYLYPYFDGKEPFTW